VNGAGLWTTLVIQSKAAPYKAGMLGVLVFVMLVVVVRQLSGGPQSADAAPSLHPVTVVTTTGMTPAPTPARASTRTPLPYLPDTAARNIFNADWLATEHSSRSGTVALQDQSETPAKAAPALVLELTFTGNADVRQHCAVISGRRVRLKDMIDGYVVESITPGLVILAGSGGDRIMLRMK